MLGHHPKSSLMSQLNRRTFIKNTAIATAVAGLSARSFAQSTGANGDLRVAVVGFRSRGMEHIKELQKIKGVRIVALCDVDSTVVAKGLKAIPGAKGYSDIRKMLEDKDIDAVSIASPNHQHSIQGIWSLQAGKHLYIEKPLSHNIFEGQQLVAASQHFSKLIVQAGTQSRSGAGIIAAVVILNHKEEPKPVAPRIHNTDRHLRPPKPIPPQACTVTRAGTRHVTPLYAMHPRRSNPLRSTDRQAAPQRPIPTAERDANGAAVADPAQTHMRTHMRAGVAARTTSFTPATLAPSTRRVGVRSTNFGSVGPIGGEARP